MQIRRTILVFLRHKTYRLCHNNTSYYFPVSRDEAKETLPLCCTDSMVDWTRFSPVNEQKNWVGKSRKLLAASLKKGHRGIPAAIRNNKVCWRNGQKRTVAPAPAPAEELNAECHSEPYLDPERDYYCPSLWLRRQPGDHGYPTNTSDGQLDPRRTGLGHCRVLWAPVGRQPGSWWAGRHHHHNWTVHSLSCPTQQPWLGKCWIQFSSVHSLDRLGHQGAWGWGDISSSSRFFCGRPSWAVLAWAGTLTLWCCRTSTSSADRSDAHHPKLPQRMVLERLLWRVTCPSHASFCLLTVASYSASKRVQRMSLLHSSPRMPRPTFTPSSPPAFSFWLARKEMYPCWYM